MGETAGGSLERSEDVESPDGEGPGDRDRLKLLCRQVRLPGVELAALAGSDELLGVGNGRRPVEALSKCLADEGSGSGVMTTDA